MTKTFDLPTLFAGGRLCLDFVNTWCEVRGTPLELIGTGNELREWLHKAESILGRSLLLDDALWEAGYGDTVLPRAIALRTALRDIFLSVLAQIPTPTEALSIVNSVLRENPTYAQITSDGAGFHDVIQVGNPLDKWMVAIAQDAVDLLCHADLSLLRQCDCPTCVRVFYDTTKNHKRRWCVEKCGSLPKAAAYYRRKVAKAAQSKSDSATSGR